VEPRDTYIDRFIADWGYETEWQTHVTMDTTLRAYFGKLLRFWGVALRCEYPNHDGLRAHGGDITPYSCGRRTNSCRNEWPRSGAFFTANEAKKKSLFEVIYLDVGWKYTVERFQDVLITNVIGSHSCYPDSGLCVLTMIRVFLIIMMKNEFSP